MSLRRRLLIGFAVVAIALVAGGISIAASTRVALIDQIDRQLSDISTPVALRFGVDAVGPPPLSDPAVAASDTNQRLSEFFLAQLDADGVEIFRLAPGLASSNDPLPSATSLRSLARKATQTSAAVGNVPAADGGTFRVRVTRSRDGTGYVVVGRSLSDVERASRRVALTEAAIASAILATLGVVAWWVLRQGVRPLAEIAATADAIAGGDLSRRVSHIAPSTEAGRVGVAFNRMTEQLEDDLRQRAASQQRLKQFVADASHELRTPLTSIRGYVDLWQQGGLRDEAKLEDALRRVGDESARMSRLIDDMLLLTRLDEGLPLLDQPVDFGTCQGF
jgi:two-component system OmpR family sensor kinase